MNRKEKEEEELEDDDEEDWEDSLSKSSEEESPDGEDEVVEESMPVEERGETSPDKAVKANHAEASIETSGSGDVAGENRYDGDGSGKRQVGSNGLSNKKDPVINNSKNFENDSVITKITPPKLEHRYNPDRDPTVYGITSPKLIALLTKARHLNKPAEEMPKGGTTMEKEAKKKTNRTGGVKKSPIMTRSRTKSLNQRDSQPSVEFVERMWGGNEGDGRQSEEDTSLSRETGKSCGLEYGEVSSRWSTHSDQKMGETKVI
ncbi:hypothetical protein LXL04_024979 [Taraxacum kok-saghyz]